MPEKRKASIDDVARRAKVSITTVSRVINKVPTVSKKNLSKVEEAIAALKYKPDIAAGVLENIPGTSVIKCRQVEFLEPRGFPLNIAGRTFAKIPAVISIIPRELRMIVGKGRTF